MNLHHFGGSIIKSARTNSELRNCTGSARALAVGADVRPRALARYGSVDEGVSRHTRGRVCSPCKAPQASTSEFGLIMPLNPFLGI